MAAPTGQGQGAAMLPQRQSRGPVVFSLEMLQTLVGRSPAVLRDADEVQRSNFRCRWVAVVCGENQPVGAGSPGTRGIQGKRRRFQDLGISISGETFDWRLRFLNRNLELIQKS